MNILKFFGSWCNPCKALSKNLEDAGIEHKSIDVDENKELTEKYNVMSVPTIVVLDEDDNEVGRFIGSRTKEQLLKELKKYEIQSSKKDNLQ